MKTDKSVIYTCIAGGYDTLLEPVVTDPAFDYICFSNDFSEPRIGVWEIRPVPFESADKAALSRYAKLLPHKVLPEYEYSFYLDANVRIADAAWYEILKAQMASGVLISQVMHPQRDCIYSEIARCYRNVRIGLRAALEQKKHLEAEGFPRHFGLYENNLLLRRHNAPEVVAISEDWWAEYMAHARRDQLSLAFVYWKHDFKPSLLLPDGGNSRTTPYLELLAHKNPELKPGLVQKYKMKCVWTFRRWLSAILLEA